MSELSIEDFTTFLQEVYGHGPFLWQERLLREIVERGWPTNLDLPTASGKTTCLDLAVFALALAPEKMPRRIFFCVDRRVIVDAAHEKASRLAERLSQALSLSGDSSTVLKTVAMRLSKVAGAGHFVDAYCPPLVAHQLRGGVFRDHGWAEMPTVPTIISTTVDQLGSRLLFRGYGVSSRALPKQAALVANDSLIILDEAHCARPLEETLRAVCRYHAAVPELGFKKMSVVSMSATPADSQARTFSIEPSDLENPKFRKRYEKSKLARLEIVSGAKGKRWAARIAERMAQLAHEASENSQRVAVMVNRVNTAREVVRELSKVLKARADLVLMTGRMRELDRMDLMAKYEKRLKSGSLEELARPIIVVATQCLEVGADFDFDALICECASLDALRQRFGRLDRLGERKQTKAVVVIREDHDKEPDPVYGRALSLTWEWLTSIAVEKQVDFGISQMNQQVANRGGVSDLCKQLLSAPILMPAHLDCLSQTNPRPNPEPEVALFLRGAESASPEVRVLWRKDLQGRGQNYGQVLSLVPPAVCETVAVPLALFRRWLSDTAKQSDETSDSGVESLKAAPKAADEIHPARGPVFRWRGADDEGTRLIDKTFGVEPNDVIILQAETPGSEELCDFYPSNIENVQWDRGDEAQFRSRLKAVLRVERGTRVTANGDMEGHFSPLEQYFFKGYPAGRPPEEMEESQDDLLCCLQQQKDDPETPEWQKQVLGHFLKPGFRFPPESYIEQPDTKRAWILLNPIRMKQTSTVSTTVTQDDDEPSDQTSLFTDKENISLQDHCDSVGATAFTFAHLLGVRPDLAQDLRLAGELHDVGKSDPRFQAWLAGGSLQLADQTELRAKSKGSGSQAARERARKEARYPKGKRHEFVSTGVVAACPEMLAKASDPDLLLYLIAVHHGFGRPLCLDLHEAKEPNLQTREFQVRQVSLVGTVNQKLGLPVSGHTERFWRLGSKYGWWNLALLEALLVCADQLCSKDPRSLNRPAKGPDWVNDRRSSAETKSTELLLLGPDGANLLGFLSTLGALRCLARSGVEARLSWRLDAKWTPVLHLNGNWSASRLASHLAELLRNETWQRPLDTEDNTHKLDLLDLRSWSEKARGQWLATGEQDWAEWLCCLAGEVANEDCATDTAFRTMSGAGHQHFLRTMRDLRELTQEQHIFATLFGFWTYEEGKPTLRFDPLDDRRYALRWSDPSQSTKDPIRSVRGANRLAVEALPLFPTWPTKKRLETAGFATGGAKNTYFHWPIWTQALNCDAVRSVLWNKKLCDWDPTLLKALSIAELYRVQRITIGKVRNFTPSQALGKGSSAAPAGSSMLLRSK